MPKPYGSFTKRKNGSTSHHHSLRQRTHIVLEARFRTHLGKIGRKYFLDDKREENDISQYMYIYRTIKKIIKRAINKGDEDEQNIRTRNK